eukprot:CAMPEP_0174374290 /NCGR_PEP_ID=MMETSP0811_2-20130205/110349_1 /TAXON_ID=73025 ORGANISM="Eutreptiella gymnastica-like, Strain CCMP1594" /NCGR_SAMPLE_ID=MMETSP0811_2 /ASSEMBLY_ACC=CAM_ASM_000667 /LENGTH=49 /DNA_ID= /DNA_START= /DNA_END= /DNA_ORIENTATION=
MTERTQNRKTEVCLGAVVRKQGNAIVKRVKQLLWGAGPGAAADAPHAFA